MRVLLNFHLFFNCWKKVFCQHEYCRRREWRGRDLILVTVLVHRCLYQPGCKGAVGKTTSKSFVVVSLNIFHLKKKLSESLVLDKTRQLILSFQRSKIQSVLEICESNALINKIKLLQNFPQVLSSLYIKKFLDKYISPTFFSLKKTLFRGVKIFCGMKLKDFSEEDL